MAFFPLAGPGPKLPQAPQSVSQNFHESPVSSTGDLQIKARLANQITRQGLKEGSKKQCRVSRRKELFKTEKFYPHPFSQAEKFSAQALSSSTSASTSADIASQESFASKPKLFLNKLLKNYSRRLLNLSF
jgi:hypothetical protein